MFTECIALLANNTMPRFGITKKKNNHQFLHRNATLLYKYTNSWPSLYVEDTQGIHKTKSIGKLENTLH